MRVTDFESELKAIDSRLTIVPNPNREQISNIKLDGIDICPIPRYEIRDETDPSYKLVADNGWEMKHKSRKEALAQVLSTIEMIKTKDGYEAFFDRDFPNENSNR